MTIAPAPHNLTPALAFHDRPGRVLFDADGEVDAADIEALAKGSAHAVLTPAAQEAMAAASGLLDSLKKDNRLIYGVTTGYGPLAGSYIDQAKSTALQQNLIYHLASGVGTPLAADEARAVVAARLATLVRGHSAARPEVARLLAEILNTRLAPYIPSKGTVGASGDLTPLSHLALALMGEGAFLRDGAGVPASGVMQAHGLTPLVLQDKDGLALVNGTSVTAALSALNVVEAARLCRAAIITSVLYAELLEGRRDAWHPRIGTVRPHPGQREVHDWIWALSGDSNRLHPVLDLPPRHEAQLAEKGVIQDQPLPQDCYSIRCVPQLVGACLDTLSFHRSQVEVELNAVTDNPLFFPAQPSGPTVLHGGNFFGQHLALSADGLTNAVTMLAVLAERQVARLTDPVLNKGLPAFLQGRDTGLHSGFMGAQVTASALLAEMRARSVPASIQSIPTNGNNQDVVPLGTIAARRARETLQDTARVLSILCLSLAQAFELRGGFKTGSGFARSSRGLAEAVRTRSPFVDADRPLSGDIDLLAEDLLAGALDAAVGMRS